MTARAGILFALCLVSAFGQQYDLLIQGGHVIDPKNEIDDVRDLAIKSGKIAAVAPSIDPSSAKKTIDAKGLYVTPGLVDMHVHVFYTTNVPAAWAGDYSVAPDGFSFRSGTTTMVDAGSSGYRNFEQFNGTVITRAKTRILAMINISGYGMLTNTMEQNTADMLPERVAALARKYKDVVVGIKTAHYEGPDWTPVDRAIEAGNLSGLPVMVDFGTFRVERPYWRLVSEKLRPGDVSTHMFRPNVPWLDDNGKVLDYLRRARARGVKFDVGHGNGSFTMRNAVPAIAQGFYPDTISSDLHGLSMNRGLMDLPTLISKLIIMGLPLKEAIKEATWNPARQIRHEELGHLTPGAAADVAVWNLMEGRFGYRDSFDGSLFGNKRLICELTLKDGEVQWDGNALSGTDYRKLPKNYGIRPGADAMVMPPK
jgi:dihydroorotase